MIMTAISINHAPATLAELATHLLRTVWSASLYSPWQHAYDILSILHNAVIRRHAQVIRLAQWSKTTSTYADVCFRHSVQ